MQLSTNFHFIPEDREHSQGTSVAWEFYTYDLSCPPYLRRPPAGGRHGTLITSCRIISYALHVILCWKISYNSTPRTSISTPKTWINLYRPWQDSAISTKSEVPNIFWAGVWFRFCLKSCSPASYLPKIRKF